MISFRVDSRSGVPPYLQIVQQVRQALRMGVLDAGDQLPTVREVVAAVAVNPNTVLKAYRELEHRGIAAGRPGQGTFVEATPAVVPPCRSRVSSASRSPSPAPASAWPISTSSIPTAWPTASWAWATCSA